MKKIAILCSLFLLWASSPALAKTVSEILSTPTNGDSVKLDGKIVADMGNQTYRFEDGTGNIEVKIPKELLLSDQMNPNSNVELIGVVRAPKNQSPHIDVGLMTVTTTYLEKVEEKPTSVGAAEKQ